MDSDPGSLFFGISLAISLPLLCLYGIASGARIALERSAEHKLRTFCQTRPNKLKKALYHLEKPQRFLTTLALVRLLCVLVSTVLLCSGFVPLFQQVLPFVQPWRYLCSVAIVLCCICVLWLLAGDLIPRKLSANMPEKTLLRTMGICNLLAILLRPATVVFSGISNGIVTMLGKDPRLEDQPVTEEEILRLIDESEEDGEIAGIEADMIENIFDFNDTAVSEIMTHRIDVLAVPDTTSVQAVVDLAVQEGYSRIPVYHKTIDRMVGVVYVKDLLPLIGKSLSKNLPIQRVLRRPYLVPATKAINKLFAEMTERKIQFAVLIDEYGGTAGIVTMEDILESIVGQIQDEYDQEEEDIFRLSEDMFTVDGSTPVDEISDLLDVELPEGDYDTIGGLIVSILGNLPEENEFPTVQVGNISFQVLSFEDNRIEKVLIERHKEQVKAAD